MVAESDGAGALQAYYVRGDGELLAVLRAAHTRFYHANATGSIRALTDEAGTVTDTYTYSAFGELLEHVGSDPQPYAFAGEPRDPNSGFAYHRARWMDPQVGRFVSADPFAGNTDDPMSLHKYLYANTDPVNKWDPSGYATLAEVSNVMSNMATLSRIAFRILNVIDRAQSVVDAVNAVVGAVDLMVNGNIVQYLDEAVIAVKTNGNIKFIFSPAQAANSLRRNYRKILSHASGPWSLWLLTHYKDVTGLLLWMPNPGSLDQLPKPIPTGLTLGRLSVSLVFGGKKKWGSVFGVGFLAPGVAGVDQKRQVWRMDFNTGHTAPNAKEIAVWHDTPFHYHVMKP